MRPLRSILFIAAGLSAALPATTFAQSPQSATISGTVYDSLRMRPMPDVAVTLSGAVGTRTAADGSYRLVTVLKGKRTLVFSEPRLDRLIGSLASDVDLKPGADLQVNVVIPRLAPAPGELCRGSKGGALVGVVRDSASGLPVTAALVAAYWKGEGDTAGTGHGVKGEAGDDGGYLLCGVPTDRALTIVSRTEGRAALIENLQAGSGAVLDMDILLRNITQVEETGRLRGKVIDSATGGALAGADLLHTASGLHAVTNENGEYVIDQVLPGRSVLVARRIGYRPEFIDVTVEVRQTDTVNARMKPVPVRLADLEAQALGPDNGEFEARVKTGIGEYWTEEEIRKHDGGTITPLLGGKASLREDRGGVLMNNSRSRQCGLPQPVPVVLDGILISGGTMGGFATNLRPDNIAGMEYYKGPAQVPLEFQSLGLRTNGFRCGLLVVWTRKAP